MVIFSKRIPWLSKDIEERWKESQRVVHNVRLGYVIIGRTQHKWVELIDTKLIASVGHQLIVCVICWGHQGFAGSSFSSVTIWCLTLFYNSTTCRLPLLPCWSDKINSLKIWELVTCFSQHLWLVWTKWLIDHLIWTDKVTALTGILLYCLGGGLLYFITFFIIK